MARHHKNKAFATLLASVFGGIGAHRYYLYGKKDLWAWVHFVTLPIAALMIALGGDNPWLFLGFALVISVLSGFIEALVIGTTPDEKWDARHNPDTGKQSDAGWPVVILLVLTLGFGSVAVIWVMARSFDLLFTGGAYG
jgi:hypothetical protein